MKNNLHTDTKLIHADDTDEDFAATPPITYSSTFRAHSAEMFAEMASTPMHPRYYTRYGNPLHSRVAKILAELESAETGLVTASGMGAISSTILALVSQGDHVIAQTKHYMGTSGIVTEMLPRFGVEFTLVDQTKAEEFERAIKPSTKLILVETPVNPTLALTDLSALAAIAKKRGILTVCDNTFACPMNQNPLKHGIDIVVHSATKYLGGHCDLTAGVILSRQEIIQRIWLTMINLGPTLSPMDAWLLLRGLRTLSLRVERQNETALKVASFLEKHPLVERVYYPGLSSHPQHELAKKQMRGFGGVLAFEYKGTADETAQFVSRLKIPKNAVSLGGVETLVIHAATTWAESMSEAQMLAANIQPNLVRLSIGLEHTADLIQDLDQALGEAKGGSHLSV